MATIGDMLMSKGMINGYNIAKVARDASAAYELAQQAYNKITNHRHSLDRVYSTVRCHVNVDGTTYWGDTNQFYWVSSNQTGNTI